MSTVRAFWKKYERSDYDDTTLSAQFDERYDGLVKEKIDVQ